MHQIWIDKDNFSDVVIDATSLKARVQEVRLIAAFLEAGFGAKLTPQQALSFRGNDRYIHQKFNGEFAKISIKINHEIPSTSVEDIKAPVIFPEWMVQNQKISKVTRYNFTGIQNKKRIIEILEIYRNSKNLSWYLMRALSDVLARWRNKYSIRLLNSLTRRIIENEDHIVWSDGGRNLSNKLFDKKYFDALSKSHFVICPEGDFPWSYRLIESILYDAIPVFDHADTIVSHFKLKTFSTNNVPHIYDEKIVAFNKAQIKKSVIKKDELVKLRKGLQK